MSKLYNFSEYNGDIILSFVKNRIRIPEYILILLNANNEEFYQNMTSYEYVELILNRLLNDDKIPSKNKFPEEYNFQSDQERIIQNLPNGKTWIPFINRNEPLNPNSDRLSIIEQLRLDLDDGKLFFRGTSWDYAMNIMEKIQVTQKDKPTYFGLRNFYTTDIFSTAIWARRKNQPAVVIFYIPNEILDNLNLMNLSNIESWKNVVFNSRKRITREGNYRRNLEILSKFRFSRYDIWSYLL